VHLTLQDYQWGLPGSSRSRSAKAMSARVRKFFAFSSRKKSNAKEPPPALLQRPDPPEAISANLPVLPPELWIQIAKAVPFENLWLLRSISRLWNWVALIRAWQLIGNSEIALYTFFASEHTPLSYLSPIPEVLRPSIPASLQFNQEPSIDDPAIPLLKTVTWQITEEKVTPCGGLRFSYFPHTLQIRFADDIHVNYNVEDIDCIKGSYTQLSRTEVWSGRNSLSTKKLAKKLFGRSRNIDERSTRNFLEGGAHPDWIVKYHAQYIIGLNDENDLAIQLDTVTLREVLLPLSQLARVWIDGLEMKRAKEFYVISR
jgi:hypothetical protein